MIHNNLINANIHRPFRWIVANDTERLAIDLSDVPDSEKSYEVYKTCLQQSDSTVWFLSNHSPITWLMLSNGVDYNEYQQTITDNLDTYITVGSILSDRYIIIDYTVELLDQTKFQCGTFKILHNGIATVNDGAEQFSIPTPPELISGFTLDSDLDGNNIRMKITTDAVGQFIKFRYNIRKISKTT